MLHAEISYDREEMVIRDLRTGQRIGPYHEMLRERDVALRERDGVLRERDHAAHERDEERQAHNAALARIAELEARLKAQG